MPTASQHHLFPRRLFLDRHTTESFHELCTFREMAAPKLPSGFVPPPARFQGMVSSDPKSEFPAEKGRYVSQQQQRSKAGVISNTNVT